MSRPHHTTPPHELSDGTLAAMATMGGTLPPRCENTFIGTVSGRKFWPLNPSRIGDQVSITNAPDLSNIQRPGARIRKLRIARGETLMIAAREIGLSWRYLQHVETGVTKSPSVHNAVKIAAHYGVTVETIWGNG